MKEYVCRKCGGLGATKAIRRDADDNKDVVHVLCDECDGSGERTRDRPAKDQKMERDSVDMTADRKKEPYGRKATAIARIRTAVQYGRSERPTIEYITIGHVMFSKNNEPSVWLTAWTFGIQTAFIIEENGTSTRENLPDINGFLMCRLGEGEIPEKDHLQRVGFIWTLYEHDRGGQPRDIRCYMLRLDCIPLCPRQFSRKNQKGIYLSIRPEDK